MESSKTDIIHSLIRKNVQNVKSISCILSEDRGKIKVIYEKYLNQEFEIVFEKQRYEKELIRVIKTKGDTIPVGDILIVNNIISILY